MHNELLPLGAARLCRSRWPNRYDCLDKTAILEETGIWNQRSCSIKPRSVERSYLALEKVRRDALSGGPGTSGVNFLLSSGDRIRSIVGEEYDLVSFDPRYGHYFAFSLRD